MKTHTQASQKELTPSLALEMLKEGNQRFIQNLKTHRDLLEQVNATSEEQFPFATILSCIDSRTSAELIFDQGLGDIFSIRIAGNILNEDILGSMEFATKAVGSKIIVVLGHTNCGAIMGACDDIQFGHLTGLLQKIRVSVEQEKETSNERTSKNKAFVENVTLINVQHTMNQVLERSPIIKDLCAQGELKIVGGLYNVTNGKVEFLKE